MTHLQLIFLIALALIFLVQIVRRDLLQRWMTYFFWTTVLLVLAMVAYQSGEQYFGWLTAPAPARYLLPPYAPISYYLFYVGTRLWLPYLLSLAFAGIAFLAAKYLNKRYEERFFYPEEYYLIALGVFVSGHPWWIGFLIIVAVSYVVYALTAMLITKEQARVSFYYLWLPSAIFIILLTPWLQKIPALIMLKL